MPVIVSGVSLRLHVSLPDGGAIARMISQKSVAVTLTVFVATGAAGGSWAQPIDDTAIIQIAMDFAPILYKPLTACPSPGNSPMPCTARRSLPEP